MKNIYCTFCCVEGSLKKKYMMAKMHNTHPVINSASVDLVSMLTRKSINSKQIHTNKIHKLVVS